MALVNELVFSRPQRSDTTGNDQAVRCEYYLHQAEEGSEVFLQLRTFDRCEGDEPGVVNQSIRFTPAAIEQLKRILSDL